MAAIITGASNGIGKAIAIHFAKTKPHTPLHIIGRDTGRLNEVFRECSSLGANVKSHVVDLSEQISLNDLTNSIGESVHKTGISSIIHCAGINNRVPVEKAVYSKWVQLISTNLLAPMWISSKLSNHLNPGQSSVIFMGSRSSFVGQAGKEAYCASKAGLLGFANSFRESVSGKKVKVSTFHLSWVDTDLGRRKADPILWDLSKYLLVEDVIHTVEYVLQTSERICPKEITLENLQDPRRWINSSQCVPSRVEPPKLGHF